MVRCAVCGTLTPERPTGRKRKYCSRSCANKAFYKKNHIPSTRCRIDNRPLREEIKRKIHEGYLNIYSLTENLGWTTTGGRPDYQKLQRRLGLLISINGEGRKHYIRYIDYDVAVEIARAAYIDPVDVGV